MSDFFKKLGEKVDEAVKEIDKFAKKPVRVPPKEQKAPSKEHNLKEILPVADVARISKLPFDTVNDHLDETWRGLVYTCSNPKIHKSFQAWFARRDPEGYDVGGIWSYLTEVMENPQPVQGIGDEAYWFNEGLFVRAGQDVLQAAGGLPLNTVMKLAKIIFDRVASD